jgi:ABC-2 type transport system permease protein/lipopolysaccharide transport system permease protein
VKAVEGPPAELIFRRPVRPLTMLGELWSRRELVITLSERELRARYKQTRVGFAWALVTPFVMMVVFTVFFKRVADVRTFGVPYPLYSYVGLLSWTFFSGALSKGAVSIVSNLTLLNKVYCPREVFPLSSIVTSGVDTVIATSILALLFVIYGFMPHLTSLWVPVLLLVQLAFTAGLTMLLAAATVYLRDIRQVLPMLLQLGLFATPVAYGLNVIPRAWWPVYSALAIAAVSSTVILIVSYLAFKRMETGFADVA